MAVYGVSPYAMPPEIAMGCMMNMQMVHGWRSTPILLALGSALGNKDAAGEIRRSMFNGIESGNMTAAQIMSELQMGMHDL